MEFKTCSETAVPTVTSSSEGGGGGQFIFPAIFSRQLGGFSTSQGGKLMDDLRPNLGLLGLVEDHPLDKRPKTEAEFSGLYGLAEPPTRALHDHTGSFYHYHKLRFINHHKIIFFFILT